MSVNAAMIQAMVDKGLSGQDIADILLAGERKVDRTAAERQARHRAKGKRNAVTSRRDPPIDNTHTPSVSPDGEPHSAEPARCVFPKPDFCDDDQVWADFLKNRKRKRLPNTVSAHKGFLDDINRIADDEWPPGRLLSHAAAKGWGGIYDPRQAGKSANDKPPASNDEIQNPYVRAAMRNQAARREAGRAGAELG